MLNLSEYQNRFIPQNVAYMGGSLDGSTVRAVLEANGYEVISNRDTGSNGEAVTACGFIVSTNGYVHKNESLKYNVIQKNGVGESIVLFRGTQVDCIKYLRSHFPTTSVAQLIACGTKITRGEA